MAGPIAVGPPPATTVRPSIVARRTEPSIPCSSRHGSLDRVSWSIVWPVIEPDADVCIVGAPQRCRADRPERQPGRVRTMAHEGRSGYQPIGGPADADRGSFVTRRPPPNGR